MRHLDIRKEEISMVNGAMSWYSEIELNHRHVDIVGKVKRFMIMIEQTRVASIQD